MARPSYEPSEEHFQTAYLGARKGLSEKQIAEAIGISYRTFRRYKEQYSPHVKKGRAESDDKNCELVESSMLKACLGFDYEEPKTEIKKLFDKKTGEELSTVEIKKTVIPKRVLANPTLIMFYLCNRNKARWQSINKAMLDTGSDIAIPVVSHLLKPPAKVEETKVVTVTKKKGEVSNDKTKAKKKSKKFSKGVRQLPQEADTKEKPGKKKSGKKNTIAKKGGQAGSGPQKAAVKRGKQRKKKPAGRKSKNKPEEK